MNMVLAMLLAHLFGDYILQWDSLSRWKSEKMSGVLVHGLIVTCVTVLFCMLIDPNWWPWAVFIGITHTVIDGLELPIRRRLARQESGKAALLLYMADQAAHLTVIALALIWSGYLETANLTSGFAAASAEYPLLTFILAYAFLTMPAWILIKFVVHGLMNGSAPDFSMTFSGKYLSMFERGLIATLILFGQFLFVPLVALPRLIFELPLASHTSSTSGVTTSKHGVLYAAELIASVALAIAIGLALRQLL